MLFYLIVGFAQLAEGAEDFLYAAQTRTFASKAAAQEFFGASFAQACPSGCYIADLHTLYGNYYVCAQYKATSPSIHQTVTCGYGGSWTRVTSTPSNCAYNDEYQCTLASNNCWLPLNGAAGCGNWCTCWNHGSGGGVSQRLGHGMLAGAAQTPKQKVVQVQNGGKTSQIRVSYDLKRNGGGGGGGFGSSQCPWWLPYAYDQLTDGAQVTCYQSQGLFCRYPNKQMNFVCSGYNGIWKLQGPAPTPEPTPAPLSQCPSPWWIWNGKWCNANGKFCRYPEYQANYVCSHGTWQRQGGFPTPTPPPNPASCPKDEHWLKRGNYCSSPNQKCHYANGITWLCDHNGVWTDYRRTGSFSG